MVCEGDSDPSPEEACIAESWFTTIWTGWLVSLPSLAGAAKLVNVAPPPSGANDEVVEESEGVDPGSLDVESGVVAACIGAAVVVESDVLVSVGVGVGVGAGV